MEVNDKLEEKLINSNQHIDSILNSNVNVKFICSINNKIMLDKSTKILPSMSITKGMLNNNNLIELIKEKLNISVSNIKSIPFEYYNNYEKRYYLIVIDLEQIHSLDSRYTFDDLDKLIDIKDYNIVNNLLSN